MDVWDWMDIIFFKQQLKNRWMVEQIGKQL